MYGILKVLTLLHLTLKLSPRWSPRTLSAIPIHLSSMLRLALPSMTTSLNSFPGKGER